MSTIIYIGAVGRSGTTLLERTLATCGSYVALGEVVHIWDRSVEANEQCGCGEPFAACPFWRAVGTYAFGGWDQVDLDLLARDRRRVDRNRYIPLLMFPRLARRSFRDARLRLLDILDRLYEAAAHVSASAGPDDADQHHRILIDSSKHPSYMFLIRSMPSHNVRLVHAIRDPRGVAYSWSKLVSRPESETEMEQLSIARTIARWTSHNLLFQLAPLVGVKRRRLPYGRFVTTPSEIGRVADDLIAAIGDRPTAALAIDGTVVELGTDHTASGNPTRFERGRLTLRADTEWKKSLPTRHRLIVGVLTTPLRQLYGR